MMIWRLTVILTLLTALSHPRPLLSQSSEQLPLDYVLHISVDGLRGDLLADRLANDTGGLYPNFRRLQQEGAYTFNARTDDTHTNTIPNHTSMLTGRPVEKRPGFPETAHHGYRTNDDPRPGWTLHNRGNPALDYIASTFDVAHDHGLRTALYTGKSKFVIYDQSYNAANGGADVSGEIDHGRAKIDQYVFDADTAALVDRFLTEMNAAPFNYAFLHFRDPDSAGHDHGWGGDDWDVAVQRVDEYLGKIIEFVDKDPRLKGRTAIVLTADHGGTRFSHWNNFNQTNYTIPVFLWSPGAIPADTDLYALYSKSITDPGSKRVTYDSKPQPMRNGGTGNLALHLLGLLPVPGSMIDSPFFITHCGIEPGESYSFGETEAVIDVIKAGELACVSVGFADTEDADYWRVISYGEGYEFDLTLPYSQQTIRAPVICPRIEQAGLVCDVSKVSDTAVTRAGITQTSEWIVRQRPRTVEPLPVILAVVLLGLLLIAGGVYWYRRRSKRGPAIASGPR